jgi:hypothetical protein
VASIVNALHEVGAARSIVVDEDNVILAGNATIEAAAEAGIERVRIVDADGEEIIAVRRSNLTPEQKTRLALFDNRAAELAEWDADVLRGLAEEVDLSAFWYDDEFDALLASFGEPVVPIPGDAPSAEPRAQAFVEIWCSTDDLAVFQPTLDAWSKRASVTVNIT